jgi:hypothetical protein
MNIARHKPGKQAGSHPMYFALLLEMRCLERSGVTGPIKQ